MVRTIARRAAAAEENIEQQLAEPRSNLTGVQKALELREASGQYLDSLESSRSYSLALLNKYGTHLDTACELPGEDENVENLSMFDAARFRDTFA